MKQRPLATAAARRITLICLSLSSLLLLLSFSPSSFSPLTLTLAQSSTGVDSSSTGNDGSTGPASSSTAADFSSTASSSGNSSASTSTAASSSTGADSPAVLPFVLRTAGRYPIDWNLVPLPENQPALSVPENTELGTCICDLTVGACDVNCACDGDCSATEINRFSQTLPAGPVDQSVPTCLDPNLVTINQRGALTVSLVENMLCVTQNNNPSLGTFLNPPASISDSQFSATRTQTKYLYEITDPLSTSSTSTDTADANYKVDDIIVAARQDFSVPLPETNIVYYPTNGGQLVVPAAGSDGECKDGNYMRYLRSGENVCRRSVVNLQAACSAGGIFSGTRYVMNIKVGKQRTSTPALPTQYVAMNVSAVYNQDAVTGELVFLGSQSYAVTTSTTTGTGNTTTTTTTSINSLTSFTFPEPVWNASTCMCDNVLKAVVYVVTNEAGGQLSSLPAPSVQAILGSLASTDGVCGGASFINQQYDTFFQLSNSLTVDTGVLIRPRSGNPGYLIGRPVLSGRLTSQALVISNPDNAAATTTVTKQSIAQDIAGLTMLPTTSDGRCSLSPLAPLNAVSFGQDAKFSCYLSLTLADLQTLCLMGSASIAPYFGNVSTSLGVWGNSEFTNINSWVTIKGAIPPVGLWIPSTRTCSSLTTSMNLEIATVDAGSLKNPQRRILAAEFSYTTSTWQFNKEDPTTSQLFPVFATVSFLHVQPSGLKEYVPVSPPLLPKFPNDLLYPLYIESAATTNGAGSWGLQALLLAAAVVAMRRWN